MTEAFIDPIIIDVIIGIILAGGVGLTAYIRKKFGQIGVLCQRVTRLQKAVIAMTKMIEVQTRLAHPEADTSEIQSMIKLILKDDD